MESTLLRIAGALFCHDPKIAAKRTEEIELNKGIEEKHIVIRPDPKLGQPGQLAHKIFIALIKNTPTTVARSEKRFRSLDEKLEGLSAARSGEVRIVSSSRERSMRFITRLSPLTSRRMMVVTSS